MSAARIADVKNWEEAAAFALGLPGTELSTAWNRPAVKVRRKSFLFASRELDSFGVASPLAEKEILIETDPETFRESDHYRGWPPVLVRHGSPDRERIRAVIARAWWDKASNAQRQAYGERP